MLILIGFPRVFKFTKAGVVISRTFPEYPSTLHDSNLGNEVT